MAEPMSMSPTPKIQVVKDERPRAGEEKKQVTMDFPKAIRLVGEGSKVHKLEWKDRGFYGVLDGGILKLHKPDGKLYYWTLNDGDILGEDWIAI